MKEIEQANEVINDYSLKDKSRERSKVYKRAYVCAYLRSHGLGLKQIGDIISKDHSSVLYLVKLHEQFKDDAYYLECINPIDMVLELELQPDYKLMSNRKKIAIFKPDFEYLHSLKQPRETYAHVFRRIVQELKNKKE